MVNKIPGHKFLTILLLLSVLVCGYVWWIFSYKKKTSPSEISHSLAYTVEIPPRARFERKKIESRSKNMHSLLKTLGYVEGTFDPDSEYQGVVFVNREKAFGSYRFFDSPAAKHAMLIDVSGDVIHTWSFNTTEKWHTATLMSNGDVLIVVKDREVLKIDKDSSLVWRKELGAHHDLDIFQNQIFLLTRQPERRDFPFHSAPILDERISVLSASSQLIHDFSLFDLIRNSEYGFLLTSLPEIALSNAEVLDILHSNHIKVFDGSLAHLNPLYSEGYILVCMRNINVIMIIDPVPGKIMWLWGPNNLTFPHHPTVLENGNILIFDNGTESSRVVELNPISGHIEWSFERADFFSATRGSAQRLSNGNTLITESDTGYVFEVNGTGDEVWRYANPDVQPDGTRCAIWRMTAFDNDEITFLTGD